MNWNDSVCGTSRIVVVVQLNGKAGFEPWFLKADDMWAWDGFIRDAA